MFQVHVISFLSFFLSLLPGIYNFMDSDAIENCMDHSKSFDITNSYMSPSTVLPSCEQVHGVPSLFLCALQCVYPGICTVYLMG